MNCKTVFYWLIAIVITAIVIAAAFYFDESVRHFVANHQSRAIYNFMRKVSRFGDWAEHFTLGLVLAAIAWWRGNKKWTRIFLLMLLALAIAGLAGRGLKVATGRARPSVKTEHVWNGPTLRTKYHAFPSGHVASSTAFFAVLIIANRRIGLACLPVPILIGCARIYIAAHYLSDVVCAAVLGILSALFVAHFLLRSISNRQSPING